MATDHGSAAHSPEHLAHLDALASLVSARLERGDGPLVVGVGGTVAAGKSTLARELAHRLAATSLGRVVEVVSTDGFLLPNAHLDAQGLTFEKGAPHTYDRGAITVFVDAVRRGVVDLDVPSYSHVTYDVDSTSERTLPRLDVLILEGLNVVAADPTVLDLVDLSVFVVADPTDNERWFVERFMRLRAESVDDPAAFFHQFVALDDDTARSIATWTWNEMNQPVATAHVLPARDAADVVVVLDGDHSISEVLTASR